MPSSISREGALSKWTNIINGWQFRWFVLDAETGLLSYFTTKENKSKGERRGCIRLKEAFVGYDNEDDVTFTITVDDKTFHLQALNPEDREDWVSKIERAIRIHSSAKSASALSHRSSEQLDKKFHSSRHRSHLYHHGSAAATMASDDNQHHSLSDHPPFDDDEFPNLNDMSLKNFDSHLAESDAYLQLLIEQLKGLEEKRNKLMQDANLSPASSSSNVNAEPSSSSSPPNVLSTSATKTTTQCNNANGRLTSVECYGEETTTTMSSKLATTTTTNESPSNNANLSNTSTTTTPTTTTTSTSTTSNSNNNKDSTTTTTIGSSSLSTSSSSSNANTIAVAATSSQMSTTFSKQPNDFEPQQHQQQQHQLVLQQANTTSANNINTENDKSNHHPPHHHIDDQEKLTSLISSTQSLIETMKHAIVCLQIAKANSDPANGLHTSDELKAILTSFTEKYTSIASESHEPGATSVITSATAGSKDFSVAASVAGTSSQHQQHSSMISSSLTSVKIEDAKQLKTLDLTKTKSEDMNTKHHHHHHLESATSTSTSNGLKQQYNGGGAKKKNPKKLSAVVPMASYSSSDEDDALDQHPASSIVEAHLQRKKEMQQQPPQEKFKVNNFYDDEEEDDEDDDDVVHYDDEDSDSFYDADENPITGNSVESSPDTTASSSSTFIHQKKIITYQQNDQNLTLSAEVVKNTTVIEKQQQQSSTSLNDNSSLTATSGIQTKHEMKAVPASAAVVPSTAINKATSNLKNNFVDLDFFNEEEDYQEDELDINNQQSVITHLLTQVRIGMDLTKITLPTFILERRSLLEMYADFFAHTDLFLEIPSIKNPRDRMIQVVKWYLSTFHAGRKSPVAKKPYNPILGEVFQCWYDIPNDADNANADKTLVTDGPIPWANRNQLTFIAEQVSHHPPISAFYAEHFNKRVQLDGYTWTKSKFLGLSIGVTMIGKAVLSLLDYDEEYVATFPSAYGRSILTVPWFEMGGPVTVVCSKTGYQANIEFLTKPFYGGKKHQISGTICQGSDKRPVCSIEGQWNGAMNIKFEKCSPELFLNPVVMPTHKKKLRPISEQSEFESRRLWREVTYHLRTKQIDLATSAKQRIEQKQRDELKERKDKNMKWQTRHFEEQGENWIYVKPLIQRLPQAASNASSSSS